MKRLNTLAAVLILLISTSPMYGQRIFRLLDPNNGGARYGKSPYSVPPFLYFGSTSYQYYIGSSQYNNFLSDVDAAFTSWNNAGPVQFSRSTAGLVLTAQAQDYSSWGPAWSYPSWNASTYELTPSSASIILNTNNTTWSNTRQRLNDSPHVLDVQSMVVHEEGHIHGLAHPLTNSYTHDATAPTMAGGDNAYFDNTLDCRSLETEDIYGADFLQLRVPTLYSNLQTALNKAGDIGVGYVYVASNYTLPGNITVPSGVNLIIQSGATVNLLNGSNRYSIISAGGTINNSGTISNLRATLTHNGSELKGLCGTIQAAVNAIPDNQYYNSYQVHMANGTFSETVNISNKYNVLVHGSGSTTIGGTVSVSNCEACTFHSFAANALSLSGCVIPDISVELDIGSTNPSLYAYNCTNLSFHDANVSDRYAYVNGIGLQFYQSSTSWMTGSSTLVYHNVRAILANSSSVAVNNVYFCNNTYDLTTTFGGTIYARLCYYPGGVPSTQGSGITIDGANIADCTGIPKRSATLSKSMVENTDTVANEFKRVDILNFDLAKKVRADISEKKGFNREDYRTDYLGVADKYRSFIDRHPGSEYSKTAVISTVHIYRLLDDYDSINKFLQSILADNNLANESSLAKRFMIDYYTHQKDFASATNTADEILSAAKGGSADTSLVCDALYTKGYIYSHDLDNKDEAVKCFSEIIDNHSGNSLVTLAENELQLLGIEPEKAAKEEDVAVHVNQGIITSSYPNPFNPVTVISYTIPRDEKVVLKVYDIVGREVARLVNEYKTAGEYSAKFDASALSSGVYFYRIQAGKLSSVGKLLLIK